MIYASTLTPGFEKSSLSLRSFSSGSEPVRFLLISEEGLAVMELQFRTVRIGAFGDLVKSLGWVLNLWKIGSETERKRRWRGCE